MKKFVLPLQLLFILTFYCQRKRTTNFSGDIFVSEGEIICHVGIENCDSVCVLLSNLKFILCVFRRKKDSNKPFAQMKSLEKLYAHMLFSIEPHVRIALVRSAVAFRFLVYIAKRLRTSKDNCPPN